MGNTTHTISWTDAAAQINTKSDLTVAFCAAAAVFLRTPWVLFWKSMDFVIKFQNISSLTTEKKLFL